jgi:hypothetical protein
MPNPDDGTFTIGNVAQTRYRLETVAGLPPEFYVSDLRVGAINVFDTGFEVGKEPLPPLQVSVRSGAGTVEGVVRDSSNRPISNAIIVVVPPDARRENRMLVQNGYVGRRRENSRFAASPRATTNFSRSRVFAGGEFYNRALPFKVRVPR